MWPENKNGCLKVQGSRFYWEDPHGSPRGKGPVLRACSDERGTEEHAADASSQNQRDDRRSVVTHNVLLFWALSGDSPVRGAPAGWWIAQSVRNEGANRHSPACCKCEQGKCSCILCNQFHFATDALKNQYFLGTCPLVKHECFTIKTFYKPDAHSAIAQSAFFRASLDSGY